MDRLYFDWNASAPLRAEAAEAMRRAEGLLGNPSSVHQEGRALRALLEEARGRVARALDAEGARVLFTSGATEANNLAILGFAGAAERAGLPRKLVTTSIEHSAVLAPVRRLEARGWEVVRVASDRSGSVNPTDLLERATGASLVSWMLANNQVGTLQAVASVARRGSFVLHTDASQAPGRLPVSFRALGAGLLTLSGHKIGGPRGVGVLVAREESLVEPMILGGDQEFGARAGTEDMAGILGFAAALDCAVRDLDGTVARMRELSARLRRSLVSAFPWARVVTPESGALPNTLSLVFPGLDGRALVVALDMEGVAVSVGSACASGSIEPSHVLLALGFTPEEARGAMRISFGATTSATEVDELVSRIVRVVSRLRGSGTR